MDLSATIHLLGNLLSEVLREQETPALFDLEKRIRALAKARRTGDAAAAAGLAAEVRHSRPGRGARRRRGLRRLLRPGQPRRGRTPRPHTPAAGARAPPGADRRVGGGGSVLLKSRGVTPGQMANFLPRLHVELVLTAHPTEAKRRTILAKLQRIAEIMRALTGPDLRPREREAGLAALRAEMTALWLTDRARTARPAVTDEVRTGLYFVDAVFWGVLPRLYNDLDAALAEHYPGLAAPARWLSDAVSVLRSRAPRPRVQ